LNDATLYLQLLVGLVDKEGNRYGREDLLGIAKKHGFDGTAVFSHDDPVIGQSPLISRELLGIWEGSEEPSILFLQILPVDSHQFRGATERFRSLVASILRELNQDAVYWFPALRRPLEIGFQNFLLMPAAISKAEDLLFPDPREVFGRQVFKTLSIVRGPERAGSLASILVYKSDWDHTPLFIPNSDWTPPYGEHAQEELIEANLRERYPFLRDINLNIAREPEWRSSQTKRTGDRLKAQTFGEFVNYTFQFVLVEAAELRLADPEVRYRDLKGRSCVFRTLDELFADSDTFDQNADVLHVLKQQLSIIDAT